MDEGIIAERYAQALFEVTKREEWDAALEQLEALRAYLIDEEGARHFIASPLIPRGEKKKLMDQVVVKLTVLPAVESFFQVLLRHDRLILLSYIIDAFRTVVRRARNVARAHIRAAAVLTDAQRDRIVHKLNELSGKQLECTIAHDPALVCGLIVTIGNRVYDFSATRTLQRLEQELQNTL